jgi:hypothetical protein
VPMRLAQVTFPDRCLGGSVKRNNSAGAIPSRQSYR